MQTDEVQQTVTLTFPARETQRARTLLEPYLLHDPELPSLSSPSPARRRLTLHPRVQTQADLPPDIQHTCAALYGEWGTQTLGPLTAAQRVRLSTVVFFSRSRPSPPLRPGLPRTWRRVLSNFHPVTLEIDGARWSSVEHWFQGRKARSSDRPEMEGWFHAAAGPEAVGPDPFAAKKAGGRGAYRRHGATLDSADWEARRISVTQAALEARWSQDSLFRDVLQSTQGLALLHFERAGARSFWGGSLRRADGQPQGHNQLGMMLMALRDQ